MLAVVLLLLNIPDDVSGLLAFSSFSANSFLSAKDLVSMEDRTVPAPLFSVACLLMPPMADFLVSGRT